MAPSSVLKCAPHFWAAAAAASVTAITPTKPCVGINSAPSAAGDASGSYFAKSAGGTQRDSTPLADNADDNRRRRSTSVSSSASSKVPVRR